MTSDRPFPGTVLLEGTTVLYLQAESATDFLVRFDAIGPHIKESRESMPAGGFFTANSTLTLPDGRTFYGVVCRGDNDIIEQAIRHFAGVNELGVATIDSLRVLVSDGQTFSLGDCLCELFDF